jgi:hypothetical protein
MRFIARYGRAGGCRQADGLPESLKENGTKNGKDNDCDQDLTLADYGMEERILNGVLRGVGGRECHCDHEICGCEAK